MKKIINKPWKRRIVGLGLVAFNFWWASYLDTVCMSWYPNNPTIYDQYCNFLQSTSFASMFFVVAPMTIGMGLIMWDTKLIQEPWFSGGTPPKTN